MPKDNQPTTAPPGCAPTAGSGAAARLAQLRAKRDAAMRMSGRIWTKDEILNGIWDMYLELCDLQTERDNVNSTRYPDLEQALGQVERVGLHPNGESSEPGAQKKD